MIQTNPQTRFFFMACFLWIALWPQTSGANAEKSPLPQAPEAHREEKESGARIKNDPFASPFKKSEPDQRVAKKNLPPEKSPEKTRIRHKENGNGPLSQFRLAGLITWGEGSAREKIAMVEDASGKGHMLRKGDAIGSGRVIAIGDHRIVIGLKIKDSSGKTRVEKIELIPTIFSGEKKGDIHK